MNVSQHTSNCLYEAKLHAVNVSHVKYLIRNRMYEAVCYACVSRQILCTKRSYMHSYMLIMCHTASCLYEAKLVLVLYMCFTPNTKSIPQKSIALSLRLNECYSTHVKLLVRSEAICYTCASRQIATKRSCMLYMCPHILFVHLPRNILQWLRSKFLCLCSRRC